MGLALFLAFFLICHVLPLSVSAEEDGSCPESFDCGNLGRKRFPFFHSSHHPDCGFCMLDCEAGPSPKIAFNLSTEQWFTVESISDRVMKLRDDEFEHLLLNPSCSRFYHDIRLPKFPSISYSILQNITLYRCTGKIDTWQMLDDFFKGYESHTCDNPVIIYYQNPRGHSPKKKVLNETIQKICSAVTLPTVPEDYISEKPDLFQLLTSEFEIQWHLSDNCSTCQNGGHECRIAWSQPGDPHCVLLKKGKKNLRAILSTVITISVIVIVLALLFIRHRKNKMNWTSYFPSRNTSEPSSNQDLEGGSAYFGVSIFSYAELEEATNNFDASKELGDGGFGTVYSGKLRAGKEVAVKRLYEHNFKRMAQFMNEIQILTRLRHRNLVTLYGCTSRRCRELLLVYEYIPNGTVADHLHGDRAKDKYLTWKRRINIAIETADALAYLHKSDIIHRDVKTNNILLDHNFCVKVADFGLSRLFPNNVSHISTAPQGTPGYVDPEYHQCYQLTDKSDVYSFGVVLIELISSMPAVDISRQRHEINLANLAINRIQRCAFAELIDPSLECMSDTEVWRMTTSVAELAFRCLQLDKDMRPKMEEVLETLKEIKNCKDTSIDETSETDEKSVEYRRAVAASPESDDIVLLKNVKSPSSPNSVADVWASGSSTTSASR